MEEAKVVKNQWKSVLRRQINTLRRLLIEFEEEDTNGVIARLKSMKDTFDQLEQAHCDYIERSAGYRIHHTLHLFVVQLIARVRQTKS